MMHPLNAQSSFQPYLLLTARKPFPPTHQLVLIPASQQSLKIYFTSLPSSKPVPLLSLSLLQTPVGLNWSHSCYYVQVPLFPSHDRFTLFLHLQLLSCIFQFCQPLLWHKYPNIPPCPQCSLIYSTLQYPCINKLAFQLFLMEHSLLLHSHQPFFKLPERMPGDPLAFSIPGLSEAGSMAGHMLWALPFPIKASIPRPMPVLAPLFYSPSLFTTLYPSLC